MKGPPEELWISPSDQLIGKVALKPPFTSKFIKACTHQGILGNAYSLYLLQVTNQ